MNIKITTPDDLLTQIICIAFLLLLPTVITILVTKQLKFVLHHIFHQRANCTLKINTTVVGKNSFRMDKRTTSKLTLVGTINGREVTFVNPFNSRSQNPYKEGDSVCVDVNPNDHTDYYIGRIMTNHMVFVLLITSFMGYILSLGSICCLILFVNSLIHH